MNVPLLHKIQTPKSEYEAVILGTIGTKTVIVGKKLTYLCTTTPVSSTTIVDAGVPVSKTQIPALNDAILETYLDHTVRTVIEDTYKIDYTILIGIQEHSDIKRWAVGYLSLQDYSKVEGNTLLVRVKGGFTMVIPIIL